jgi:amino acid adenylation domain-containing protein
MTGQTIIGRLLDLPQGWLDRRMLGSRQGSLTFGEVRESALSLARWLAEAKGIAPCDRVALCLPRTLEAVCAIYGILAAGASYAPLPAASPPARLAEMLVSLEPKLLIIGAEMRARLARIQGLPPLAVLGTKPGGAGLAALLAEGSAAATPAASPTGAPSFAPRAPEDLAAIYFTSGSTGLPKGVMLSQRGMAEMAQWIAGWNAMTEADRLGSDAGLHYATAFDLFSPLWGGGSTVLIDDREAMFPERVAEIIEKERVTIWCSSATTLRLLLERGDLPRRDLGALRRVEFFGEPLAPALLRQLMASIPAAEFVNFYGASEAHRVAAYDVPRPLPEDTVALPVGRPTDNYRLTLRDGEGRAPAPGEPGEICVAGPRCMLGYWKDEAQTAAKRVPGEGQSYRTGDLARFDAAGLLHLIGRQDQVVKLRGNRFDLGELESVLKSDAAVRDAIAFAFADPSGETELRVALLTEDRDIETRLALIMAERLPGYARPARIALFADFPRLATGKIDRQKVRAMLEQEQIG